MLWITYENATEIKVYCGHRAWEQRPLVECIILLMACRLLYWHIGNCKPPSPQRGNEMILGVDVRSSAVETCCLLRREKKLEYREERREKRRRKGAHCATRWAPNAKRKKSTLRVASSEQRKKTNNQKRTTNFVPKLSHILQPSLRNLLGTGALAIGKKSWGYTTGIDRYQ